MLKKRNLFNKLEKALGWSPVVLLTGPRQAGKTTLVKQLGEQHGYSYVSFDNLRMLAAAQEDQTGFIDALKKPVIIDEVQRVPEIFLAIKHHVDTQRIKGQFLLTGSANPLDMSNLGDSLSGRMLIFTLLPLSQGELNNHYETFIDDVFNPAYKPVIRGEHRTQHNAHEDKTSISKRMLTGGFPDVQDVNAEQRNAWFDAYLTTRLQKDVHDLARIEGLTVLPNLMALLATRTCGLMNTAELARSSKIATSTLHRYLALLKTLYLIDFLPVWNANLSKRLIKSPKLYLIDTGIGSYLLGADEKNILANSMLFGSLLENFIVTELTKQITWSTERVKLYHFRTASGIEVDLILENAAGNIVAVEVKSSQTVKADDFKGIKQLQQLVGDRLVHGIVLYTGTEALPFGDKLYALPVASLWTPAELIS